MAIALWKSWLLLYKSYENVRQWKKKKKVTNNFKKRTNKLQIILKKICSAHSSPQRHTTAVATAWSSPQITSLTIATSNLRHRPWHRSFSEHWLRFWKFGFLFFEVNVLNRLPRGFWQVLATQIWGFFQWWRRHTSEVGSGFEIELSKVGVNSRLSQW